MAEAEVTETADVAEAPEAPASRKRLTGWRKWVLAGLLAIVAIIGAAIITLNTPIGQRFIANEIAKVAPASGLKIEIGRIEGDIYGKAKLHDVVLSDPKGPFMRIPLVELDWRPLSWITRGLDVRELITHRGTLLRVPELNPGDPDAPILPNFDIRIDRFEIDDLTIAPGLVGDESHKVNLLAKVDIRQGRAYVKADGRLGARDRLALLLDAEPDGDRFDVDLDYDAPEGGVIAGLLGAEAGYRARIEGDGTWSAWKGGLLVTRNGERFAAFRLTNKAGRYGILGQAYPTGAIQGLPAQLLGAKVSLAASGTLVESVLDGRFDMRAAGFDANGEGAVDLAGNAFDGFEFYARLRDPNALSPDIALNGANITATLDGDFRDLTIDHRIEVRELVSGETRVADIRQAGTATYDGNGFVLPLAAQVGRITTGSDWLDPRLVDGRIEGELKSTGSRLFSDRLQVNFPGADATLALRGDLSAGSYELTGPVRVANLKFDNVGNVGANARINFRLDEAGWTLRADTDGRVSNVSNATLANLAGPQIAFRGQVGIGSAAPLTFRNFNVRAQKLTLTLDGRIVDGTTTVAGRGRHVDYGPFTVEARVAANGPEAVLVFANPLPSAGLTNVRVAISPTQDGFRIETEGGSLLGPFSGTLGLVAPANGPTRIAVEELKVWKTDVTGNLVLVDGGVRGSLALAGGGLDGTIRLLPRGGGQGFDASISANGARFAGPTPLSIARGNVEARGTFADGNSTISAEVVAQGITYGSLFVGRLAADADLTNGAGKVLASVSGRRGSQFNINLDADVAPRRIALAAKGSFAGQPITMPRRAVLTALDGGGWQLAPTQINYSEGRAIARGTFGTPEGTSFKFHLVDMPLSLVDVAIADMGLGGKASGVIDMTVDGGVPVGTAKLKVDGLTRSGLVLTSKPIDLAMALDLGRSNLRMRAAIDEDGQRRGRLQVQITGMPASGAFYDRMAAGRLFAQARYDGPAAALWRLAAIDVFDLTGPVKITADATGSIANPRIRGAVASDDLRLQSGLSGTDIRNATVRGRFNGARLTITRMSGKTPNGGTVSGSGIVDMTGVGEQVGDSNIYRGPRLDLRLAAKNAALLDANGLSATVSGPLRIVSSGVGGTIAGRLSVNRASWGLSNAEEAERIPQIATREINTPADVRPSQAASIPWRYLIDAKATSRIDVDGMGLDSEWGADILLRGTTDEPRIGGEARVVRGSYSFAGTRFELTRGRIDFDENTPIDPRLDIRAETDTTGLTVEVRVGGSATQPEISFTSVPSLPEDEILARLLFGGSITELSATDALQLGAAVASLRGGGGMDPINKLRTAIGLDRLRIVGADPALDRGTGVALGKNFGRRFYVEIITDGRGYSATELEFRVTSWLSLLASISTIGRESVVAEVSKDY